MTVRYMKVLLASLFAFLGVFTVACFVAWCVTGELPDTLIECLFGGIGVECAITGGMKIVESIIEGRTKPDVSEEAEAENNGRGE